MTGRVAGLLLAAGGGRRYGMPKALVPTRGRLLVEIGIRTLRDGGCEPLVVVLGAAAPEVQERVDLTGCVVVVNDDWASGMGSSLRSGLAALEPLDVEAVVVLLVDTPGVTASAVRRARSHAGTAQVLAAASYDGSPGHPVLLGREHWSGVAALAIGDVGARGYLAQHADQVIDVPCADVSDGADIDRPADAL